MFTVSELNIIQQLANIDRQRVAKRLQELKQWKINRQQKTITKAG